MKTKIEPFKTKLGTNKGVAKSRIWIEGARLIAAGFTVGQKYDRVIFACRIVLTLNRNGAYKVCGKGDHPIIDITGAAVTQQFTGDYVTVTYSNGLISIE